MKLDLPKVIAHRGASIYAPENTLTAFIKAYESGASWVEFDVKLTADHQLIVFHDDVLDRTTDGEGWVADHDLKSIKELEAGSWFGNEFSNETIPTLEEVIDCLATYELGANIEIKPNPGQEKQTALLTLSMVEKHWPKTCPEPLFSSFSRESLLTLRTLSEQAKLGLLLEDWPEDWLEFAQKIKAISIHVDSEILTKEKAEFIKQAGFYLLVYTVDDISHAEKLFDWGVDAVFSNLPDLLSHKTFLERIDL